MSKVISIRLPDDLAAALDATQQDARDIIAAALTPDQQQQQQTQQISRITIRIDMR